MGLAWYEPRPDPTTRSCSWFVWILPLGVSSTVLLTCVLWRRDEFEEHLEMFTGMVVSRSLTHPLTPSGAKPTFKSESDQRGRNFPLPGRHLDQLSWRWEDIQPTQHGESGGQSILLSLDLRLSREGQLANTGLHHIIAQVRFSFIFRRSLCL